MAHRVLVIVVLTAWCVGAGRVAQAFERDTHYYLTFALSLSTCFDSARALCDRLGGEDPPAGLMISARIGTFQRTVDLEVGDQLRELEESFCKAPR